MFEEVYHALRELRPPFAPYEADLHRLVESRLISGGFAYEHEARVGAGCRVDYLVGGVAIEIKKGRPAPAALLAQLQRYMRCEAVRGMIVVSERSVALPPELCGKPLRLLALRQLWGVALP